MEYLLRYISNCFEYFCIHTSVCVCVCIYGYEQWNILFIIHREGILLRESSSLHVSFWQKFGLLIYYSYYTWKKQYICNILFSFWCHIHPFPFICQDNASKSNSDLKVNLEECIKEIYREKNWMALLIQRWLMALVNPAIAVGVCMLTDTMSEC